jgi:hypothetical protein
MQESIHLFYSYAHEDEPLRRKLETHLALLQQQGLITSWHDRKISAGTEWAQEISTHLDHAQIILLLVSSSFLASKYCYSHEMMRALERHEAGTALVVPIILRPVHWKNAPFSKLRALPTDGKPITGRGWHNQDEAFANVAAGIQEAAEKLRSLSTHASQASKTSGSIEPQSLFLPAHKIVQGGEEQQRKQGEGLQPIEHATQIRHWNRTEKQIFLSHSPHDSLPALKISNLLEDAGYTVWQDTNLIKGGTEWVASIEDDIERANAVITLLSHESLENDWVTLEFLQAERRNKCIIPLRIDDCEIPKMMRNSGIIDAYPHWDSGITKLLTELSQMMFEFQDKKALADERHLEIAFLDRMLLEYSVWKTLYTPMAGILHAVKSVNKKVLRRVPTQMESTYRTLRENIRATFAESGEIIEESFDNVTQIIDRVKQLVLLGEPGIGKTTTLWKLAADYAASAKQQPTAPLPILLHLGTLTSQVSLRAELDRQLGSLSFEELLSQKRLVLLFDGLNEVSLEHRAKIVAELHNLVQLAQRMDTVLIITCRELDYQSDLVLNMQQQVRLAPLDPGRIRQFVTNYLPEDGENLFWQLLGADAKVWQQLWKEWQADGMGDFSSMWISDDYPKNLHMFRTEIESIQGLRKAMRGESSTRSMLALARNPYILYMITEIYAELTTLPSNKSKLFELFIWHLLWERERFPEDLIHTLRNHLANLAYTMQRKRLGSVVGRTEVLQLLPEKMLYYAVRASLLEGNTIIRFTHQLLQEFFATYKLDQDMQAGTSATNYWPATNWWKIQGWEDTAILLAGKYENDTTPMLQWLQEANPLLAARCMTESGTYTPEDWYTKLRSVCLLQLANDSPPKGRAALGRALGLLGDPRPGVGLRADGIPDIVWCAVPSGEYIYGEGELLTLPDYYISKYPITYIQYQAFIDAKDGFGLAEWWHDLAAHTTQPGEQRHKYGNHPREHISWYDAVAFCRWLSSKLGYEVRLPTEQEWEKAARGMYGLLYAYGNMPDASRGNFKDTGIDQSTAVGIFNNSESPYGVIDMNGNVWEWTLNEYLATGAYEASDLSMRPVRGGSWSNSATESTTIARYGSYADFRHDHIGMRIVASLLDLGYTPGKEDCK